MWTESLDSSLSRPLRATGRGRSRWRRYGAGLVGWRLEPEPGGKTATWFLEIGRVLQYVSTRMAASVVLEEMTFERRSRLIALLPVDWSRRTRALYGRGGVVRGRLGRASTWTDIRAYASRTSTTV